MCKFTFSCFLSIMFVACSPRSSYDIIIVNGSVYDGSGATLEKVDIGIKGDQILTIGDLANSDTKQVIDAQGLVVAPGFIDTHVHLDPMDNFFKLSTAESHVRQGVTTSFGGPDGRGVPYQFDFQEYLDTVTKVGVGMNVGFLAGHNKIRKRVLGLDNRRPTPEELDRMRSMVIKAMDEGAFGISTGLKYLPGNFSKVEELIELSKEVAEKGGVYTSHLRDEGLAIMPSCAY